jgi:hypothetical protein
MHPRRLVARGRGLKAILLLCPLVVFSSVVGYALYAINDLYSYTYRLTVNYGELYPVASINATVLHDMAFVYEDRLDKYHVPLNLTIMTWFNPGGSVNRYDATENAALWNGKAAAAAAMHYWLAANGTAEKDDARRLVHKLATGLSMQIAVPNGGLGPGYTNTVARFYVPPWVKADGNYTWMFDDGDMNFNGTGPYKDWRCKLTTSKDELGGYFLGIAALQRFVTDDPFVVNLTRLIAGQLAEGFIRTNWQELDGDGLPNGVNLNPMLGITSEWKLLIMRLATRAYPENLRYQQLYDQFAADDYGLFATPRLDAMGCISAYYGYGFVHDLILGLVLAETKQAFLDRFIANYEQQDYPIFNGHRNAYFNAIFLAMNAVRSAPTATYDLALIRHDVLDQLWRFNTSGWCPMDDTYGGRDRAISRGDLDPLGQNWTIVNPAFSRWKEFALLNAIMPLTTHYLKPLAADMMGCSDFIWGDDPFDSAGGRSRDSPTLVHESPGTSFTLPYYLLRVFGYL